MDNLRQFERFPLNLPVRAEVYTSDTKQMFDLKTRDISASGVFVFTPEQFPNGTNIKLNMVVPNDRIKKVTGANSLIDCEGNVVRFTPSGVAINFNKDCRISSLIGL